MNRTILFGYGVILLGVFGMIASWQSGTPFFRCDGVYGENSYASSVCFNGSILLSGMIIGVSHGFGLMLCYFGYKDEQELALQSQDSVK